MAKRIKKHKTSPLYRGKRHYDEDGKPLGGIPVVVDESHAVEVEGGEVKLCQSAYDSTDVLSYKNKTNLQILNDIHDNFSCKFEQPKAESGDFILCRLVINDPKLYNRKGTVRQILDEMQSEKSCRVSFGSKAAMKDGGKIKFDLGGVIDEMISKKNIGTLREVVVNTLLSDAYYDSNSVYIIADGVINVDDLILKYTPYNPILTNFGEYAYFYPHQENILRDGIEAAYIKYAAHMITFKNKESGKRMIDVSKERAIQLIEPALREADARYIHKKDDGNESIIYVKKNVLDDQHTTVALVIEMNLQGQLRLVSFMPNRKKISANWIESTPIRMIPRSESEPSNQLGTIQGDMTDGESPESKSKGSKNIDNNKADETNKIEDKDIQLTDVKNSMKTGGELPEPVKVISKIKGMETKVNPERDTLLKKTEDAISQLTDFLKSHNNRITIDGREYEYVSNGKYTATVKGGKGATYTIGVSPKAKAVGGVKDGTIYFVQRNGNYMGSFTIVNDKVTELVSFGDGGKIYEPNIAALLNAEVKKCNNLECDGTTRVLHYVLNENKIPHEVFCGSLSTPNGKINLHYWIVLEDGRIVDYKAKNWLGEGAPNGIFEENPEIQYEGEPVNMKVSKLVYNILTKQ